MDSKLSLIPSPSMERVNFKEMIPEPIRISTEKVRARISAKPVLELKSKSGRMSGTIGRKYVARFEARGKMPKEDYWNRVRLGLCLWCSDPAMPGKRMCKKHNRIKNELQNARYWNHVSLGLCGYCSNPPMPGTKLCEDHKKYISQKKKESRLRRIVKGKCLNCGKLKEPGAKTTYCNKCRRKFRLDHRRHRANKTFQAGVQS